MNLTKLNILSHSLGLVATISIATGALADCSTTTPESSSTSIAATPTQTSPATPSSAPKHNMGSMGGNMSMDLGPADEHFDHRFIDAMIPRH